MTATRLPRGRHHLPREEVIRTQRERMMLAMAQAMAEKGYVATSVADVIKGAGVSRETFYQQFSSKLDCFMGTFDAVGELLFAHLNEVIANVDRSEPAHVRFERLFRAYIDTLASQPAFARVFTVEVYAAGPDAMRRRAALQLRIADALVAVLDADTEHGRFACQLLVAGVSSMVTVPLVEGDLDGLRALRDPVVDFVRRSTRSLL